VRSIALGIILEADATQTPADQLLKARLRAARLDSVAAAQVVQSVFSWYRWRGFLEGAEPSGTSLRRALALASRFAAQPETFDPVALLEGALPAWARTSVHAAEGLAHALQAEPPLWLRARKGQAREILSALPGSTSSSSPLLPEAVLYLGTEDLFRHRLFSRGRFEIQDIASQGVGAACAPAPGETWWDACAGQGGKTLHLADLMENRGLIWATDRSENRLATLRTRAARAGIFNYRTARWLDPQRTPTGTRFDGVLVDAPCSGLGTWARNPHARWTVGPADVAELALTQKQLLATAATAVKPGGRLLYAVCTLTREETLDVAEAFGQAQPDFEPTTFADPFAAPDTRACQALWPPQLTGGNGMFLAAWRRKSR